MPGKRFRDEVEALFLQKQATSEGSTGNIDTWAEGKEGEKKKLLIGTTALPDHMTGTRRDTIDPATGAKAPKRGDIHLKR